MRQVEPLLWLGPVTLAQAKAASLDGQLVGLVQCSGTGQPVYCESLAASGLFGLLKQAGLGAPADASLAAYSNGGSAVKRLLLDPAARDRVRSVYLADAMYMTSEPPEGFVAYGADAVIRADKLLVATASSAPNKNYPNGIETMRRTRDAIEARTGQRFGPTTVAWPSPPTAAYSLGNVHFAEYASVSHGDQVTKLAPAVFEKSMFALRDEPAGVVVDASPRDETSPIAVGIATLFAGMLAYSICRALIAR